MDNNRWISDFCRSDIDSAVLRSFRDGVLPNVPYQFSGRMDMAFQVWLGIGYYEQVASL